MSQGRVNEGLRHPSLVDTESENCVVGLTREYFVPSTVMDSLYQLVDYVGDRSS